MPVLQSQSDCCVHNMNDQMNHIIQGSLSRSSGKAVDFSARGPGLGVGTLSKNTKIIF